MRYWRMARRIDSRRGEGEDEGADKEEREVEAKQLLMRWRGRRR